MSALRDALKAVKSDIRTVEFKKPKAAPAKHHKKKAEVIPLRPKQNINGYEVNWQIQEGSSQKIPYIQNKQFFMEYPSKNEDIKLPEGTVRASYNKDKKRVEFFKKGDPEPIRYVMDSRHEALPIPRYMSELERVEEIYEIDLETGEISCGLKIDILPEGTYWKLLLQEFEAQQLKAGVSPKVISFRLQKYLKNLEVLRGVTVEQLAEPIPQSVLDAISYAEKKQLAMKLGK